VNQFKLRSEFKPAGDQPIAITALLNGLQKEEKHQVLLGVTGSGKTYSIANVIAQVQRPTLVLAHNKTLAAQLCSEFQEFFPENAVCYFVSYYDYYQPEAYIAKTDTYIEKDASINEEINKFRHAATDSLLTRNDVIIVASVSAIYGLGSVDDYNKLAIELVVGQEYKRDKILRNLTTLQYTRSQLEFKQGMFHVLGDVLEIFPPSSDNIIRLDFFGDELESIQEADSFTGELIQDLTKVKIFPAKHNVTTKEKIEKAVQGIRSELEARIAQFQKEGRLVEAERLQTRTEYDLEMMQEVGYCSGIENYVRYLNLKEAGDQPTTLFDYFPKDFLLCVDESHITIPQIGGMHEGNLSRKRNLIEHGFRLPSAYDNRPLMFSEFEKQVHQVIYISATPGKYELEKSQQKIVEQIIRPTGLIDPEIRICPTKNQIDDIMNNVAATIKRGERVLLTTLTKKSAEDLTEFLSEANLKVKYLHSDIDTMERIEILRELRTGTIDIIVGINLLREGLDLPEVSFIGILDADKQGFLRSRDALIQTIGRAARNVNGQVVMYANVITVAMQAAIAETDRRRKIQVEYNQKHGITPQTIIKKIRDIAKEHDLGVKKYDVAKVPKEEIKRLLRELENQMFLASQNLEFEKASELRDQIDALKESV
jgi:excinuclease ABC subunit B